jgi:hypothetical protein
LLYGRYARPGKERVDALTAVKAIREVVGESSKEFESVAIEKRTSKAALTRAAKAIGKQPKLATAVVARIRQLGGIKTLSDERPVGEFDPNKYIPSRPLSEIEAVEVNRLLQDAG